MQNIVSITNINRNCACGTRADIRVESKTKRGLRLDNYCKECVPNYIKRIWKSEGGKL